MAKSATQLMDENSVGGQIKSWPQRTKSFYNDVRMEMQKVSAPSLKEVQATTVVVIITVAIFGLFFWVVDLGLGYSVDRLLRYFTH